MLPISTIGHSTHSMEDFIGILKAYGVRQLVDVRTVPRSRRVPQFNRENLPASLQSAGLVYRHLPGLGGLRKPTPQSVNTGWRNASFRGYADYMQTEQFRDSLQKLIEIAQALPTAIMCAEALPWRCHRSLIADALVAKGIEVNEILSATKSRPHEMTAFAQVHGDEISYPDPGSASGENLQLNFNRS